MSNYINTIDYNTEIPAGGHWSVRMRRGTVMRITDLLGGGNLGMLFYNPENLLERYNAPDTLKCQHTFKLTTGHCLYSDMGHIFASIVEDSLGWHETVCGNSRAEAVAERWGKRDYQQHRNDWHQNGYDSFLIEMAKYGLSKADLAANINWFSKVATDQRGAMYLVEGYSSEGSQLCLRFEMDTLVLLHTCPHPLNVAEKYPRKPIQIEIGIAKPVLDDDLCKNSCSENQRGFKNNALYYLGSK